MHATWYLLSASTPTALANRTCPTPMCFLTLFTASVSGNGVVSLSMRPGPWSGIGGCEQESTQKIKTLLNVTHALEMK